MNKTVLITGASRGIGANTARLFAAKGYQVVINYNKSEKEAFSLCAQINKTLPLAICLKADVSNRSEVEAMFSKANERFGTIDVLVNNAGTACQELFLETTEKQWDSLFDTNIKGMYHCCQMVLPQMISRKEGSIINISSVWGICGASCEVAYSAAKAAVIGFTKALAQEMGPSNIRVNCVAPGVVETDMMAGMDASTMCELAHQTPLQRNGQPEDIANVIYFLASNESSFLTGQVLSPNGGFVI